MSNTEQNNEIFNMTATEIETIKSDRLAELIIAAGYPAKLAAMLGSSNQVVNNWINNNGISRSGANAVSNHATLGVHFTFSYLRPDLVIKASYINKDNEIARLNDENAKLHAENAKLRG